jgi:nucleoside-diphosphate-sugar epimerase
VKKTKFIRTAEQLDDLLSQPTEEVIEQFGRQEGDIILLGAGGKMGPSLARMAWRACQQAGVKRRIIAVSRFSDSSKQAELAAHGIQTIRCDLLDDAAVRRLPEASAIIYMVGMKFGSAGQEAQMWAINSCLADKLCRRFRRSRIVAFSTGNVYGLTPVARGGSREDDVPVPVGEYAMSCLGRERIIEHVSRVLSIPTGIIRLNYASELRYGVLVDLAGRVLAHEAIDLGMGYFNTIWQGDANVMTLLAFQHLATPPFLLNVTGAECLSVREVCLQFGELLDRKVTFTGVEAPTALLSNSSRAHQLFGPSRIQTRQMIVWVADWIKQGGLTLGHQTHFETRDGKY